MMTKEEIDREIDKGMAESGSINRGSFAKYTKQEKIRSGTRTLIGEILDGYLADNPDYITDAVLAYLHLLDVAIIDKERELPYCSDFTKRGIWCPYIEAGYVATIPLIEKE